MQKAADYANAKGTRLCQCQRQQTMPMPKTAGYANSKDSRLWQCKRQQTMPILKTVDHTNAISMTADYANGSRLCEWQQTKPMPKTADFCQLQQTVPISKTADCANAKDSRLCQFQRQ